MLGYFFKKKSKVLHVAPEIAFIKKISSIKNIDYYSCDLNSPLAKIKADICDLPFENKYFDWVLCNHVLEHIKDDESAIKEIFRVLKPGGKAIMQVPLNKNLKKNSNLYDQYEAKARLNLINKIYQSHDNNLNEKYKVEFNERTIERVKNSF